MSVQNAQRLSTGSSEFDRVLGGGLLQNSVVLLSGEPGIGKSTLLLQLSATLNNSAAHTSPVLYICAEESPEQIKLRALRLNIAHTKVQLSAEYQIEKIEEHIEKTKAGTVIIDSIQSIRSSASGAQTGGITQLRECINYCYEWSQRYRCSVIIVAHVTKDGSIAGPKLIEHLVDTVVVFEQSKNNLRFLYARKNRFGAIDEVGVFKMTEKGLEDIQNAGIYFLEERKESWPAGICISATYEGSRPFLVELQALTVPVYSNNRVFSEIVNSHQIFKIAAVLERHCKVALSNHNMYVNSAGGIKIQESGTELAIALSLYSAYQNTALPINTCAIGEVSLAGEIRSVQNFTQRCKQLEDFGIKNVLVPRRNLDDAQYKSKNCRYIPVRTIQEAIDHLK